MNNTEKLTPVNDLFHIWIKACGLLTTLALGYSFTLLPSLIRASQNLLLAQKAYKNKSFEKAQTLYSKVLQVDSTARAARIGLFETRLKRDDNDEEAFNLVNSMPLSKNEYERLVTAAHAAGFEVK